MVKTYTREKYQAIVASLADRYAEAIEDNATRDIAEAVIAHCYFADGEPVVELGTTVYGESNDAIGRALFPHEVLTYSESKIQSHTDPTTDERVEWAIRCLVADLQIAHGNLDA
jgi:hypothetical protein